MRIARFFLKNGHFLDLPLADGQGVETVINTMKLEGHVYCERWAMREDAWSFIAILDIPQQLGGKPNVVPFGLVPTDPSKPAG